jgi:hypothetical protein
MCGMVNRPTAQICECGHHFDDERNVERFLRARVTTGWLLVSFGLLFTIASVCLIVVGLSILGLEQDPQIALYTRVIAVAAAAASVAMFVKGTRIVDAARARQRELEGVPRARVVER